MSQQKENQFRDSIHKHMIPESPHQEKMHNPFRGGTPDDYYSGVLRDLWVEYKYSHKLISVQATNLLSDLQYRWLTLRHNEGRNVLMIVGFPQGGLIVPREEFEIRIPIMTVQERLLKRKALAAYLTLYTMGNPHVDI